MMEKRHILLLFLIGFLLIGEVILEFRDYARGYQSLLFGTVPSMLLTSNTCTTTGNNEPIKWGNANDPDFPFRSKYITKDKGENSKRIWILSSSMTEDIYLPPESIWPNILENLLEERKTARYQVLNAAKFGMDISDGLQKLQKYYNTYKPDIVIVYEMSISITRLSKSSQDGIKTNVSFSNSKKHWSSKFAENTALYTKAKNILSTRVVGMKMLNNSLGVKGRQTFVKSLQDVKEFCDKHAIELILCTFATQVGPHNDINTTKSIIGSLCFKNNPYLSAQGWITTVKDWNEEIKFFASENSVTLIDIDKALTGENTYFRDYVHFTKEGHSVVAKIISSNII